MKRGPKVVLNPKRNYLKIILKMILMWRSVMVYQHRGLDNGVFREIFPVSYFAIFRNGCKLDRSILI